MDPAEYAREVVLPTVAEFMAARGDRRRAYLACIAAYHLVDYVARSKAVSNRDIIAALRSRISDIFDIVQGVCNGSKHCGADRGTFKHSPGSEIDIPVTAYGVSGGYGYGRYGGVPGLMVEHNGQRYLVDDCVAAALAAFEAAFPECFAQGSLRPLWGA